METVAVERELGCRQSAIVIRIPNNHTWSSCNGSDVALVVW